MLSKYKYSKKLSTIYQLGDMNNSKISNFRTKSAKYFKKVIHKKILSAPNE